VATPTTVATPLHRAIPDVLPQGDRGSRDVGTRDAAPMEAPDVGAAKPEKAHAGGLPCNGASASEVSHARPRAPAKALFYGRRA